MKLLSRFSILVLGLIFFSCSRNITAFEGEYELKRALLQSPSGQFISFDTDLIGDVFEFKGKRLYINGENVFLIESIEHLYVTYNDESLSNTGGMIFNPIPITELNLYDTNQNIDEYIVDFDGSYKNIQLLEYHVYQSQKKLFLTCSFTNRDVLREEYTFQHSFIELERIE